MLVKLKDIVTLINGRAYSQPELQDKGKYRIVRVGNFSGKNEWFYSDMELDEDKYCEKGDLLYKWACNFGPEIWKSEKTIFHYHIWKIKWDKKRVDKMFLYYLLMYMTPYWLSSTNGSIMVHITKETMEEKIVDLPPLETQKKISRILENLDNQIEKNLHIVKRLQVMGQAAFSYFSNSNKKQNVLTMKEIIEEKNKSKIQVNNVTNKDGNIPFFTSGETLLYTNEFLVSGFNIFLSTGGNAKVQFYFGNASYSTDTWCITANNNLKYYLYFYLKQIESQMDRLYFHGTGLKHLQKQMFLKSKINVPNEEIIMKFNKIVESNLNKISKLKEFNLELKTLKNKLLPLLINQQII